jgi:hypothetical protein
VLRIKGKVLHILVIGDLKTNPVLRVRVRFRVRLSSVRLG